MAQPGVKCYRAVDLKWELETWSGGIYSVTEFQHDFRLQHGLSTHPYTGPVFAIQPKNYMLKMKNSALRHSHTAEGICIFWRFAQRSFNTTLSSSAPVRDVLPGMNGRGCAAISHSWYQVPLIMIVLPALIVKWRILSLWRHLFQDCNT